jgi:hypothetical protein
VFAKAGRISRTDIRRSGKFHGLRHTCATLLAASARPVSKRPGHKSVKTTLEIYAHALPSQQADAAPCCASTRLVPIGGTGCLDAGQPCAKLVAIAKLKARRQIGLNERILSEPWRKAGGGCYYANAHVPHRAQRKPESPDLFSVHKASRRQPLNLVNDLHRQVAAFRCDHVDPAVSAPRSEDDLIAIAFVGRCDQFFSPPWRQLIKRPWIL